MNKKITIDLKMVYEQYKEKAFQYFFSLQDHLKNNQYKIHLREDFNRWKKDHIHLFSPSISKKDGKIDSNDYSLYLQYLKFTGKLDSYLYRSISYIFMRDLGKALYHAETKKNIKHAVVRLKKQLTKKHNDEFSMARVYRWAQKEGIESSFIWLMEKIKDVREQLPEGLDKDESERKLIKIIAGVVIHALEEMDVGITMEERKRNLEEAIRLGYYYGLTYPFIDDLLDSQILSLEEKKRYSDFIAATLTSGTVPELGKWSGKNEELMNYIYVELREAFQFIAAYQNEETRERFFADAYIFFQAQETDRNKSLKNADYSNEELYIPVILKSAASRLIVRSIIGAKADEGFEERTFYYGIYNQLADDFTDMFEDMEKGAVTPYTYYLTYHDKRKDLINPFEMYWTVISYLIHHVYESDPVTREVILSRAINGLKRFKKRLGKEKYNEVIGVLTKDIPEFNEFIQVIVSKADNVDFFDKLLRDHIKTTLKQNRVEREEYQTIKQTVREKIDRSLNMEDFIANDTIYEAAHYSLKSGGKRIRSIVAWMMGIKVYDFKESQIWPILRALEYMHTASLIFDDLPSQDDASFRRGKPTLHEVYNISTAELTGLFLTQKAVHELTLLSSFNPQYVLALINYASNVITEMCRGQAIDLESKDKKLTLEELNTMCFYKTGLAFEASLLMPAILANVDEKEKEKLKTFAYHAGIAFQIKDDLLDATGNEELLGKPIRQDKDNNRSTFVSVLGEEGAKKEMWNHYCYGMEVLEDLPKKKKLLKHVLNYFVNRNH